MNRFLIVALSLAPCGPVACEAGSDALLKKLVEKGVLSHEQADAWKEEIRKEKQQSFERYSKSKFAPWIDQVKWRGDPRVRAEMKFEEWASIGMRLATAGEDPVSANQSFRDAFSRKDIRIDLACVTLQPPDIEWFSLTGGKMKNPIWQSSFNSPLQYDGDVTPEGVAEQLQWTFGDKKQHRVFGVIVLFALDEIGADANDPCLAEIQGGAEAKVGLVRVGGAATMIFYLDDFVIVYGRGEVAWTFCEKSFLGTPSILTFSGEYLHNLSDEYEELKGSTQTNSPWQTDAWTVRFDQSRLQRARVVATGVQRERHREDQFASEYRPNQRGLSNEELLRVPADSDIKF